MSYLITRENAIDVSIRFVDWNYSTQTIERRFQEVIRQCRKFNSEYFHGLPGEENNLLSLSKEDLGMIAMAFIQNCGLGTERERAFRVYEAVKILYPQYDPMDLLDRNEQSEAEELV